MLAKNNAVIACSPRPFATPNRLFLDKSSNEMYIYIFTCIHTIQLEYLHHTSHIYNIKHHLYTACTPYSVCTPIYPITVYTPCTRLWRSHCSIYTMYSMYTIYTALAFSWLHIHHIYRIYSCTSRTRV